MDVLRIPLRFPRSPKPGPHDRRPPRPQTSHPHRQKIKCRFHVPTLNTDIEKMKFKDPEFWKVFGLGQRGNDGKGNVFHNWKQLEYSKFPNSTPIFGMDFGFSNDPTTLIEVRKQGNNLYLKEHLYINTTDPKTKYRNGLDTKSLINELNALKSKVVLTSNNII